ncbi:subtype B tannase [Cardiobacterium hominis]|uniref:subtype B tannase n=1 Tax=Cardiobacterium hominis TaxID=2718 RepID=UPI0028D8B685|nr:subtype B tannase [Cardiobacterium hominis]
MKKTAILAAMSLANLAQAHSLDFAADKYTAKTAEVNGATIAYRAYEGIPYVNKPVEPEYQQINIYIPEAYYEGGSINGYTAATAPIFLPNQIGGYMPAKPGVPGERRHGDQPGADAMQTALAKGYIVASPGARGRTSPTGKAPAAIYDLKAAVRYLRHNDAAMPGDAEKIISNGTSAGGALSILLGASITDGDERKLLVEIMGAADARDDIYAVSAYCPISILEHADAAYEWEFNGVHDYEKMDITMLDYKVERKLVKGTLDAAEQRVSDELKAQFPAYVNSLGLKNAQGEPLTLNADGSGSFRDYVASYIGAAADAELNKNQIPGALGVLIPDPNPERVAAFVEENPWLTIDGNFTGNHVKNVDFAAYAKAMGRQKTPPAFDALDLSSGENQLFGDEHQDTRHFTAYSAANSAVKGAGSAGRAAVKTMNPLYYISEKTVPQHWRIRVGTKDRDTSHAIAAILAAKLQNSGKNVDMAMPWGVPHSGDYDLDELFAWMDGIVKGK